jgi:hypothetical protein
MKTHIAIFILGLSICITQGSETFINNCVGLSTNNAVEAVIITFEDGAIILSPGQSITLDLNQIEIDYGCTISDEYVYASTSGSVSPALYQNAVTSIFYDTDGQGDVNGLDFTQFIQSPQLQAAPIGDEPYILVAAGIVFSTCIFFLIRHLW